MTRREVLLRSASAPPVVDGSFVATVGCLADIVSQPVVWLWGNVIPQGMVTLLTGPSGVGKSFVALDIAAAIARGERGTFPDPSEVCDEPIDQHDLPAAAEPGDVLLIVPEYELADVIRPRLEATGVDVSRVHVLRGVHRSDPAEPEAACWMFRLEEDLRLLEQEIERRKVAGSAVRLIVIDPFPLDEFEDRSGAAELRHAIKHLAEIAAWSQAAILLVSSSGARLRGSSAHHARALECSVPSAWSIVRDLTCHERKLLLPMKANLAEKSPGRSFLLRDGQVRWDSAPVWRTMEQFQAESLERSRSPLFEQEYSELGRATQWLRGHLQDKAMPYKLVKDAADFIGIANTTLRRAFCRLKGISWKIPGTKAWAWSLPDRESSAEETDSWGEDGE